MQSPFINDPFAMLWKAFKKLYPDADCEIWYDTIPRGEARFYDCTFSVFFDDGSTPQIVVFLEYATKTQIDAFAHELAHVACGNNDEHGEDFMNAHDALLKEYEYLNDKLLRGETE